ncbi:MAG TPA: biotin/lipoyl-binding protein [Verrucomicrobiae bacterium]|jgi:multidrug efflux system membrane fusion protein|nr:biotin/lipoyl-binding protein [Verrucomicrobiae bacterium]
MEENAEKNLSPVRKSIGRVVGIVIIIAAIVVMVMAIWIYDNRPQTDDATLRANFIGVAPQASGHVIDLRVKDNQVVNKGDVLFVIDPRPYEHALAKAKAALVLSRKEVEGLQQALKVGDASISRAEAQRFAAEATVERAEAEAKDSQDHVKRLEPLLTKEFATLDLVEAARTRQQMADSAVNEAKRELAAAAAGLEQAKMDRIRADDAIGQEGDFNARIGASEAEVREAELNLEFCTVRAPFSGKVVNLNISLGEFARVGVDLFTLVDTSTWYAVANFRETQLKHIAEGDSAEIYLQYRGGKRFKGKVVGLAWAVLPEYGTAAAGLPNVPRNLDWVRLAQRFPVRVEITDPDDNFRIGASAVVTIDGRHQPARDSANRQN